MEQLVASRAAVKGSQGSAATRPSPPDPHLLEAWARPVSLGRRSLASRQMAGKPSAAANALAALKWVQNLWPFEGQRS